MNKPITAPAAAAAQDATGGKTAKMNMIQAINSAMDVMLGRDPDVLIFGEDVGYFGGVFRATEGLQKKYGLNRCFDTPITEAGLIGAAVGMAAYGLRPCVEIQFADYIYPGYDQIVSEAARLRYRSAGDFWCPMTIRTPYGGGIFGGQTHSQSPGDPIHPLRCERPADRRHRGRRPGDHLRAQAALQRPLRRQSRHPGDALAEDRGQ
jgi:2-oxoisovalerate dehydrogenase E1 component beta subunit